MKILYISGHCTKTTYNEIIAESKQINQQLQKFGHLISEGLFNNNVEISVLSKVPINNFNYKRKIFAKKSEYEKGVCYHYIKIINLPILNNISIFFGSLLYLLKYGISNKNSVFICDPMLVMPFIAAKIISKILKIDLIAILTDIPNVYAGNAENKISFPLKISSWIMKKADGYVLLTNQMNEIVNPNKKKYIIMEGMTDVRLKSTYNTFENKYQKKVCMYTGGIVKIYGLDMLINAFSLANIENSELHIYGGGPYANELKAICKEYNNIKYFGVKSNEFIVKEQMKATLLINPRLTNYDYTKYSFPSKIMEYIASGTPTLTTILPGMPKEYYKYVFTFDEETVTGMANKLKEVLSIPTIELHNFGYKAKKWILNNKNNSFQMKRVVELINMINER